ncbi:MAG: cobalamin-binding protein [Janthinobacterium lividum]
MFGRRPCLRGACRQATRWLFAATVGCWCALGWQGQVCAAVSTATPPHTPPAYEQPNSLRSGTGARAAVSAPDDSGARLTLPHPATRVISLAPHATELVYAAGGGAKLVGVGAYSDYPSAARALPRVGDSHDLDIERIAALRPDLVIAWRGGTPARQVARLQQLGIPVFLSGSTRLGDIPTSIENLGVLLGSADVAAHRAQSMRTSFAALANRFGRRSRISVFFEVSDHPLMTIGGQQIINDVISLCGGRNVFGGLSGAAPTVSLEAVVAANPEVILTAVEGHDSDADQDRPRSPSLSLSLSLSLSPSPQPQPQPQATGHPLATPIPPALTGWLAWPQLSAVAHHALFGVPADWIDRPGPRIVSGATAVCERLDEARHLR